MECRICFETHNQETLISPCKCSGTSKYVHKECLDKWIVYKKNDICSVCQEKYSYYPQENDKTMALNKKKNLIKIYKIPKTNYGLDKETNKVYDYDAYKKNELIEIGILTKDESGKQKIILS